MQNPLLTTKQAAQILGVSIAFLERDRWAGARAVRYRHSDLLAYIESRACINQPVSTEVYHAHVRT